MALDVGFEVTPSNGLGGQIEVASSNDLEGRGLKRPRRPWPQTTSEVVASNDLGGRGLEGDVVWTKMWLAALGASRKTL